MEERGKYSSRAGSGSSWAQLLLCAAGAITGVTTQVCSAASAVTGLLLGGVQLGTGNVFVFVGTLCCLSIHLAAGGRMAA